ncbi:MAG: hypothetical protein ACI90V_009243, partial [Bacillariaceae sp.]
EEKVFCELTVEKKLGCDETTGCKPQCPMDYGVKQMLQILANTLVIYYFPNHKAAYGNIPYETTLLLLV